MPVEGALDGPANLNLVLTPVDHTGGAPVNPVAQVAGDDLALGKFVDTVSHSKYATTGVRAGNPGHHQHLAAAWKALAKQQTRLRPERADRRRPTSPDER